MERSISTSSETTLFGESTSSFSGSSLSVLEQLQSSLKQKEGELSNSQVMVASLERSRASLTQELATVSERNEVLEQKVKMIPDLQQKLKVSENKIITLFFVDCRRCHRNMRPCFRCLERRQKRQRS